MFGEPPAWHPELQNAQCEEESMVKMAHQAGPRVPCGHSFYAITVNNLNLQPELKPF